MKKLLIILVLSLVGNIAFAETTDKHPKRPNHSGFNYSKNNRKQHRIHVLNRLFNLNNCKGYRQGQS
jgi:hypothetical protein